MHRSIKAIISFVLIFATAFLIYFGSVVPIKKSKMYNSTLLKLSDDVDLSVEELVNDFEKAFSFYSPIGNDELASQHIRFINYLARNNQASNDVLLHLIDGAIDMISEDVFMYDLYMAQLNNMAFQLTDDEYYFYKAEENFWNVINDSPNLPHALEGLLMLYNESGMNEEALEIAERILEIWPDHPAIQIN